MVIKKSNGSWNANASPFQKLC